MSPGSAVLSRIFLNGFVVTVTLSVLLWVSIGVAFAQSAMPCDKRTAVTDHLKRKYEEAPSALGVANNGGLVELLKTEEGKTWTLIITLPNGMTCLLSAGEDWERIPAAQFGEGS